MTLGVLEHASHITTLRTGAQRRHNNPARQTLLYMPRTTPTPKGYKEVPIEYSSPTKCQWFEGDRVGSAYRASFYGTMFIYLI